MYDQWDADTLFDVLERQTARRILALTSVEPMSAQELASQCEKSEPTIYRRVDVLEEYDLLEERDHVDADGTHYKVYETNLDSICFELRDGGFTIDVSYRRDLVDDDLGE
ncbi:ArsR/SmtB family transcription factor [Haloarchaeobius sp. DFWS5]|uniref:ArsR/SmtB family transcription factor n=1 Tax=Haloarchaeobius sp. DFWS5 TaxID=3446114 RepID=UPI003EBB6D29